MATVEAHYDPQRLRAIEETEIRPEAAALEIGEEVLADAGVLGRAVPEAERMLLAVGGDPERDDQAVVADADPVENQADQLEAAEGCRLPRCQLRRGLRHGPPTDGTLARAPTPERRRRRFEATGIVPCGDAHQQLIDDVGSGDRCPARARTWGAGPRRHRHAPVADAPPASGRQAPSRCSRCQPARPGDRPDAQGSTSAGLGVSGAVLRRVRALVRARHAPLGGAAWPSPFSLTAEESVVRWFCP